jgi:hypothetical protein
LLASPFDPFLPEVEPLLLEAYLQELLLEALCLKLQGHLKAHTSKLDSLLLLLNLGHPLLRGLDLCFKGLAKN